MTRPDFSELETDATIELINQGIGRAAEALSIMLNEEVTLSVPDIHFVEFEALADYLNADQDKPYSAVFQHFHGDFSGNALFAFPESCGQLLVKQMLAELMIDNPPDNLQEDALLEMGNIVLNACFGQLGELLSTEFDCEVPIFLWAQQGNIYKGLKPLCNSLSDEQSVMLLQVDLIVHSIAMRGFVAFIMNEAAMAIFRIKVRAYLKRLFN